MGSKHPFVAVSRREDAPGSPPDVLILAITAGFLALGGITQWIADRAVVWSTTTSAGTVLTGKLAAGHLRGILLDAAPEAWSPPLQGVALWLLAWAVWRGAKGGHWVEASISTIGAWVAYVVASSPLYFPGAFAIWLLEPEPTATPARIATTVLLVLVFAYIVKMSQARPVANLHGSSRFAEREDLRERGLLGSEGIVLGWLRGPWFLGGRWRAIRHAGVEHVLVLGETRAGKTSEQLVPTLLDWNGHVVVGDFKDGELYQRTAGALAARGFRVIRFAPLEKGGAAWNPLLEIEPGQKEIGQLMTLAEALIPLDPKGTEHFPKAARELFLCLALHVLYANPPGKRSIGAIRDLLVEGLGSEEKPAGSTSSGAEGAGKGLYKLFRSLAEAEHDPGGLYDSFSDGVTHEEVRRIALGLLETPDKELGSIGSTLRQALQPWADSLVCESTERSDVKLALVRRDETPTAIYMTIPLSEMDRMGPLIRLFAVAAAKRLTELGAYVDQAADERDIHRVLMVLEEFPAMGKVDYVSRMLSTVGGYGLTMMLCVQTLSQLKTIYGANEPISGGCPVMVVNSTKDIDTVKAVSTWSGEMTVTDEKSTQSHSWSSGSSTSQSKERVKRPLLTEGEVRALPPGRGVVFFPACPTIMTLKRGYYRIPEMLERSLAEPPRDSDKLADPLCPWSVEQPVRCGDLQVVQDLEKKIEEVEEREAADVQ